MGPRLGWIGLDCTCVAGRGAHGSPASSASQVRLQLQGGGSPFAVASQIVKKEGFSALYTGLSAGMLRQVCYTSSRLGIFKCARIWFILGHIRTCRLHGDR